MQLQLPRNRVLNLHRCQLMGILNLTPDSFSDGGNFVTRDKALRQVALMIEQGAQIIDIGGESTRPGATKVSLQQELDRVIPLLEMVRAEFDPILSIDTYKPTVMAEAVKAGADIINDVKALQEPNALEIVAKLGVPVCLMHMQGTPETMQLQPDYQDVVHDVQRFLLQRVDSCIDAGIASNQILLDPGFGFGKNLAQNYRLLAELKQLSANGFPILAGMSRKSMIGHLLNVATEERLAGSIACATIGVMNGARIIRAHDVKATADAIAIAEAVLYGVC